MDDVSTIGLDLAKHVFQVRAADASGRVYNIKASITTRRIIFKGAETGGSHGATCIEPKVTGAPGEPLRLVANGENPRTESRMFSNQVGLAIGLLLGGASLGSALQAEVVTFQVVLAGSVLGTLEYETAPDDAGRPAALRTNLDNTPLGVFDGTWEATSQPVRTEAGQTVLQYLGTTASTRKDRVISILHDDGQALETVVSPIEEATDLSQADRVPPGFLDPVQAFGRLIDTRGCPEPLRIYDGRRVVEVSTLNSEQGNGTLTCQARYEVILGPGLLSPLRFNSVDVELTYALTGAELVLAEVEASAGIFSVRLVR